MVPLCANLLLFIHPPWVYDRDIVAAFAKVASEKADKKKSR